MSLLQLVRACVRHAYLINQITRREISSRYRGSIVGLGWSFLNPVLMLAVFTFVFSVVFEAKWDVEMTGQSQNQGHFAMILFMGLIAHGMLAEVLTRSPMLIVTNPNFVKKVIFPLEVLPVSTALSALFHGFISVLVWLIAHLLVIGLPPWQIIWLPLVFLPFFTLCLGISYSLAALGVFMRDIGQTMGILVTVLLFMSPVFFPVERLPEAYQPFFMLNPLTFVINQLRAVALWGQTPDVMGLSLYGLAALGVLWLGFAGFQRTRQGFADVL
jgi:lipopolysaccharide transport system permease protein